MIVKSLSSLRRYVNRKGVALPTSSEETKKSKREFPVREFMESEEKYLANLCMVRDSFQLQLQHMTSETSKVVFFRLQELIVLHGGLNR